MSYSKKHASMYADIGQQIEKIRLGLEISQEELANSIGVKRATLANIEGGAQQLFCHTLINIADALGVELMLLLPKTINETPSQRIKRMKISRPDKAFLLSLIESDGGTA